MESDKIWWNLIDFVEYDEVLSQGKELEWWERRDGRSEGDDEAFAGQVPTICFGQSFY